jgi:hypothetical protein
MPMVIILSSQSLLLGISGGHYSTTPLSQVIEDELLRRGNESTKTINERFDRSPILFGAEIAIALLAFIWHIILRYGMIPSAAVLSTFLLVHSTRRHSPRRSCHSRRISIFSRSSRARVGLYSVLRPGNMRDADERCFEAGTKQFSPNNVFTNSCHMYLIHEQIIENLVRGNRLNAEEFCTECIVVCPTDMLNFALTSHPDG